MSRRRNRLFSLCATGLLTTVAFAGSPSANSTRTIDESARVRLTGNVHPLARPELRVAPASRALPMERMVLVLGRRAGGDAKLEALLTAQHDPRSPQFHKWLTPEQFGRRFGVSDGDLAAVTGWLESHGFRIEEVAPGRGWINFSGSVDQVENAFQTQIDDYLVGGKLHHANSAEPSIPAAISDIVHGVLTLHDFYKHPMTTHVEQVSADATNPQWTNGSSHYLSPGDSQTIYNVKPLYSASINGTGQTIAIVGRTDIKTADVKLFRSAFGLPAKTPTIVHNGTAPGDLGGGEETEADLDVEWSGAIAKNATTKFVVSKSTSTTDGVDLSAQYIVSHNLAPVMSTSFGQCEKNMGTAENAFYKNLWSQAATQGITAFISSDDSGAAGCETGGAKKGTVQAVNGLASTPYNVAVGGTQFSDTSNPSKYWNATNTPTYTSAKGYIPEKVWNESGSVSGGSGLWSSGGGKSTIYAKPVWQSLVGVPADGKRDVPDVSLAAAGHDGYLIVQGGGLSSVGGTSAASPSFASIMALVVEKKGARQGNANVRFYALGKAQYNSGGTAVFHDTKTGSNTVPGVTGFAATTGYDRATGLGSVNVNTLVTTW
jgi:subtilase family serine protease